MHNRTNVVPQRGRCASALCGHGFCKVEKTLTRIPRKGERREFFNAFRVKTAPQNLEFVIHIELLHWMHQFIFF